MILYEKELSTFRTQLSQKDLPAHHIDRIGAFAVEVLLTIRANNGALSWEQAITLTARRLEDEFRKYAPHLFSDLLSTGTVTLNRQMRPILNETE